MLILAHRGYHAHVPENTLEAFKAAIALGVDGIETDIRLSADQEPILYHNRVAPNGQAVASLSKDELSTCVGYAVPTLADALELSVQEGKAFIWNLELKTPAAAAATVEIVRRYLGVRRFLITSFWHPLIQTLSQQIDVDCGMLVAHRPLAVPALLDGRPTLSRVNTVVWYYETIDGEAVAQTAAAGWHNFVYGVTTLPEHQDLTNWPVDGLITDHPDYCLDMSFQNT